MYYKKYRSSALYDGYVKHQWMHLFSQIIFLLQFFLFCFVFLSPCDYTLLPLWSLPYLLAFPDLCDIESTLSMWNALISSSLTHMQSTAFSFSDSRDHAQALPWNCFPNFLSVSSRPTHSENRNTKDSQGRGRDRMAPN